MAEGFLERLLGYHDVRFNGGSKLPRRNLLNFVGGQIFDRNGETQIVVADNPIWLPLDILDAQADDYAPLGHESATDIPVSGNQDISGLSAAGITFTKQRIWNFDETGTTRLLHEDAGSQPGNRFVIPGGSPISIASNGAIAVVRNITNTRWLVLPCLA